MKSVTGFVKNISNNAAYKWKNSYIKCAKYKKFKNLKTLYSFNEVLALSNICDMHVSNIDNILEEEGSIEILKIIGLINSKNSTYIVSNVKSLQKIKIQLFYKQVM